MQTMTSASPDAHVGEHSGHTPGHRHRQWFLFCGHRSPQTLRHPRTPPGPVLASHFPLGPARFGDRVCRAGLRSSCSMTPQVNSYPAAQAPASGRPPDPTAARSLTRHPENLTRASYSRRRYRLWCARTHPGSKLTLTSYSRTSPVRYNRARPAAETDTAVIFSGASYALVCTCSHAWLCGNRKPRAVLAGESSAGQGEQCWPGRAARDHRGADGG